MLTFAAGAQSRTLYSKGLGQNVFFIELDFFSKIIVKKPNLQSNLCKDRANVI